MSFRIGILILLLAVPGCAAQPDIKTVTITVTKYVPVPDKYTTKCPIANPTDDTVEQAIRTARARRGALGVCNEQLKQIKYIQGKQVTTDGS